MMRAGSLRLVLGWALKAYARAAMQVGRVVQGAAAWLPSTVLSIAFVSPRDATVQSVYNCLWRRAPVVANNGDAHGVYAIEAWNAASCARETYLLRTAHLLQALPCKEVWALTDAGLVHFLHAYVRAKGRDPDFFDIAIGETPAQRELKPVLRSLGLADNVTAEALARWFAWKRAFVYSNKVMQVTTTDTDLRDTTLAPSDFLH